MLQKSNRPILGWLLHPCQSNSLCQTILIKLFSPYGLIFMQIKLIFIHVWQVLHDDCFETEAQANSEITYCLIHVDDLKTDYEASFSHLSIFICSYGICPTATWKCIQMCFILFTFGLCIHFSFCSTLFSPKCSQKLGRILYMYMSKYSSFLSFYEWHILKQKTLMALQ